jgi:hypothetical protein
MTVREAMPARPPRCSRPPRPRRAPTARAASTCPRAIGAPTRTVFYRHFDGLPQLLVARLDDLRAALTNAGDPLAPGYTEAVLRGAVAVFAEHGVLLRAIEDAARRDADVEAAYSEFTEWAIDATAELFDLGVAAGNLEPFDTRNVARALTLANRAYLMDAFGGERSEDPEVVLRTLMTIWMRTLGVEA